MGLIHSVLCLRTAALSVKNDAIRQRTSWRIDSSPVSVAIQAAVRRSMLQPSWRAVIEENFEAIKAAFSKVLRKGSPYAFQVLSDRAYGKLKETHAIEHNPYKHLSDEQLNERIKELEERLAKDLGYIKVESQPQILPPAKDDKVQ
jgi:hypothetical protein